jgi:hypothetical protein
MISAPEDPQDVIQSPEQVSPEQVSPEQVIECVSQPAVVITEQALAFSTAAAVSLPRTKPTHRVIAAVRAMFLSSSKEARPVPRHYPPLRDEFLENAAMRREMRRL